MKKTVLLFIVLLIGISAFARKVEKKDALLAGKNFYYEKVNINDAVPYESIKITSDFTRMEGNEPAFYIFNINEDKGFVIVSAEDAAIPVLGYSFSGTYTEENLAPSFKFWIDGYAEQIRLIRESGLQADLEINSTWNHYLATELSALSIDRSVMDVAPLVTSTWNQDFPYNALCPQDEASGGSYNGRVPVGCVATTLSQIMYYWRYPAMGNGSHCIYPVPYPYGAQCADFGATTYDWNGMSDSPNKECYPAALISYHLGVAVDMDYGPDGSGAYISDIPNAISNYFKYSTGALYVTKMSYSSTNWENLLKGDLDGGKPIEYAGFGPSGGHAWVCDGYQGTNYFHFNWGWGGSYDGYFYLSNLNPGGSTFTNNQQAVVHIQPDAAYYPDNCSGQKIVNTYDFGTIEDGSGPVADYQNNSNCSWLIAPDDSISKVILTFQRFETDPSDFVTVYDGNTTSAPVLGTFSGTSIPAVLNSTGPQMLVTFISNSGTTGQGFLANYQSSAIPFCSSNTTITEITGDIDDGSGRFQYRNSSTCKWKIQPENAVSVTLAIDNINIEEGYDFIEVYDVTTSEKIGSFTGNVTPAPVTCNSGKMMVLFKTNSNIRGEGFSASWSTIVSTQDKAPISDLNVYPNPAENIINVDFSMIKSSDVRIDLISASGISLISKDLGYRKGNVSEQVDVSKVSSGVYILRILSDQGLTTTRVVVK